MVCVQCHFGCVTAGVSSPVMCVFTRRAEQSVISLAHFASAYFLLNCSVRTLLLYALRSTSCTTLFRARNLRALFALSLAASLIRAREQNNNATLIRLAANIKCVERVLLSAARVAKYSCATSATVRSRRRDVYRTALALHTCCMNRLLCLCVARQCGAAGRQVGRTSSATDEINCARRAERHPVWRARAAIKLLRNNYVCAARVGTAARNSITLCSSLCPVIRSSAGGHRLAELIAV